MFIKSPMDYGLVQDLDDLVEEMDSLNMGVIGEFKWLRGKIFLGMRHWIM